MNSKVIIPDDFKNKFKNILKNKEFDLFIKSCKKRLTKSIIINKLKYSKNIKENVFFNNESIQLKEIPYINNAYFIENKVTGIGNSIEQLLGYFQIQEVSSMIPAIILDPNEKDIVLDLTAAPGNKTALMAQIMNNKGLIIANDINKKRIKTLIYTLKKLGITNTIITNKNGVNFNIGIKFTKILLDAPCSCEGTIRKKPNALTNWSENLVLKKAKLQKKLIDNAFKLLEINGELVYSTCTLSPEENEEVIDYLLKKYKSAKVQNINLKNLNYNSALTNYKNKTYSKDLIKGIRIYPHKTDLEGFFICKIKKIK